MKRICLTVLSLCFALSSTAQDETVASSAELARELDQRYANIERLREDLGIYDAALAEAYSDTAAFLSEQQRYDEAIALYDQALQITRINSGLYSADQLPIIQALISNNRSLKDWREVDKLQELNLHMQRRMYGSADSRYIASLGEYGRWKLQVLHENLLDVGFYALNNSAEDLSETYGFAIRELDASGTGTAQQLVELLSVKSEADLLMARAIAQTPYTAFEGTASRYINQQRCTQFRNSAGQLETRCVNVRVENPQYRASQRNAKNFALARYTRAINDSIERLMALRDGNPDFSIAQVEEIDSRIATLQLQSEQLRRSGLRGSLL